MDITHRHRFNRDKKVLKNQNNTFEILVRSHLEYCKCSVRSKIIVQLRKFLLSPSYPIVDGLQVLQRIYEKFQNSLWLVYLHHLNYNYYYSTTTTDYSDYSSR